MSNVVHIPVGKYDWLYARYDQAVESDTAHAQRTLVIMLHGYPDLNCQSHGDLFGRLETMLTNDGFDTLRFDFRGCGQSEGNPKDFSFQTARQDLQAVYEWAQAASYRSLVVIAEDFGGCIALMEPREEIKALVLLWPMLEPKNSWLAEFIAAQDDPKSEEHDSILIGKTKVGKNFLKQLGQCDMSKYIAALSVPVLVQHGDKDTKVPIAQLEQLREFAKTAKRIEITSYESGAHGLGKANERKTMFHHVRQFIKRYS